MGVLERMLHHIWKSVAEERIAATHRHHQRFPSRTRRGTGEGHRTRTSPSQEVEYDDAIRIIKEKGGTVEWGDDIDAETRICWQKTSRSSISFPAGRCRSNRFTFTRSRVKTAARVNNCPVALTSISGRDEMTSGGQREHRIDVLVENLRTMDLDPEEFEFYVAGFRHGVPPPRLGAGC